MKKFISKYPYVFSVAVFIVDAVLAIPFVILFKLLDLDIVPLRLIIPASQSLFVLAVIYYLGWFNKTGFRTSINNLSVLWFPLVAAFIPLFLYGSIQISSGPVFFYSLALIFTGISEEGVYRGIILRAMLSQGKWPALIFMSMLFSAGHLSNLFFEDFSILEMLDKLLITFSFSLFYGAVFLRTFNIWPLIILHTLHDLSYLISGTAGPYTVQAFPAGIHILISLIYIIYAVYILRNFSLDKEQLNFE